MEAEAAVALLHAKAADSVLLMRRAEREDDSWSGHWSLPGGRWEPADVDLLQTALRELQEECGIRLGRAELASALPYRMVGRRVGRFFLVAPFVFHVQTEYATILDPLEAAHAEWLPFDLLRDVSRHRLRTVPNGPPDTVFPAFDLEGAPLWGFTYRLLCDYISLTPVEDPALTVLQFLLDRGLTLEREWSHGVAEVRGTIPVGELLDNFCRPGPRALAFNRLEVRPDCVRLLGPRYEERVIRTFHEPD